jgi:hypothetical protein
MHSPLPLSVLIRLESLIVCWYIPQLPNIIEIRLVSDMMLLLRYGIPSVVLSSLCPLYKEHKKQFIL